MVRRCPSPSLLSLLAHSGFPIWGTWGLCLSISSLGLAYSALPAHAQTLENQPELAQAAAPTTDTPTPAAPSTNRTNRPTLRLGSEGESVRDVQAMLMLLGLYAGPVDGLYTQQTTDAVANFQEVAGLTVDGIVGPATWSRLLPAPPSEANPPTAATSSSSTPPAANSTATPPSSTTPPAENPSATPSAPNNSSTSNSSGNPASAANPTANTAPAATPAATANMAVDLPILKRGMHGPAVSRLQERLNALEFYTGAIDGIFGVGTEEAVKQAQRAYRLEADGIVGPATWSALLRR